MKSPMHNKKIAFSKLCISLMKGIKMVFPKKNILNAVGYEPPLYLDDYLMKLDLNENILGTSPKVIEAIKNITEQEIKFYPAPGESY